MSGRDATTQEPVVDVSGMMILTMASVFVGFLLFGAGFWGFMNRWPQRRVWFLVLGAFLMVTFVPVAIALFHAATGD